MVMLVTIMMMRIHSDYVHVVMQDSLCVLRGKKQNYEERDTEKKE